MATHAVGTGACGSGTAFSLLLRVLVAIMALAIALARELGP